MDKNINKDYEEGFKAGYDYALNLNYKDGSVDHERIKQFINKCCILGNDYEVEGLKLYEKYIEYCKELNISHLKIITFYRRFEDVLNNKIQKDRFMKSGKRIRGFKGIKIKI